MSMLYLRNKPIGAISGGGSGGGHVIENASGTDLAQRDTLKFSGYLQATDDSTNEKSVVSDAPTEVEYSVWQTMTDQQKTGKKWIIKNVPKTGGTPTDNSVSVTADGVKTFAILLNELYALIDENKVTRNTKIVRAYNGIEFVYSINRIQSNNYNFTTVRNTTADCTTATLWFSATNSAAIEVIMTPSGTTLNPQTSTVLSEGTTFTLYYNLIASPGIGDITADDVSYGSGTVADALDGLLKLKVADVTVTTNQYGQYYINEAYPNRVSVISMSNSYWCVCEGNYVRVYDIGATTKATNKEVPIRVLYY